jgi:hypothetical protein
MLTLQQREHLRIAALGFLAARHPIAFAPDALRMHLRRRGFVDFDFSLEEIGSAMMYLQDLRYVHPEESGLGAGKAWLATAAGVLQAEKEGWLLP